MPITLEQVIKRENNNFDLIRLLAALSVIFGHSFDLFLTNGYDEPVRNILIDDYSGSLAVYIFFFLSGIFITASFASSKTFIRFWLMRVFRIWPALILCIFITVFIVGPIFTPLSLHAYFLDDHTWEYYIKNNTLYHYEGLLYGVFNNNHFCATNGALWTLPIELRCYFLVFILGVLGLFRHKITVVLFFTAFILFRNNYYLTAFFLEGGLKLSLFFLSGMMAFTFRQYIIINYKLALILIAVCTAAYYIKFQAFNYLFYITLIYTILVMASNPFIRKIKPPGDYSYGIYIYGFLIQQIVAHIYPAMTSYPSMLITIPAVSVAGILSWHYIESPAINLGKKIALKYNHSSGFYQKDLLLKGFSSR
jgi:peptidoglycan/LPS O-acetylase OafA/YrhL